MFRRPKSPIVITAVGHPTTNRRRHLVREPAANPIQVMNNVDPTLSHSSIEGGRLLIVDDEAVIRFVLRCELEQRGYTVTEVENGRRAIEQFSRDPSCWIGAFVDFLLPDAHGDELIEQFLNLRPDLPVVLMTGDCDPDIERMAKELQLTILRKPFSLERVRPLLEDMRRRAQLAGQPPPAGDSVGDRVGDPVGDLVGDSASRSGSLTAPISGVEERQS